MHHGSKDSTLGKARMPSEPHTALAGTHRQAVLDAEADKDLEPPVIHDNRNGDGELASGGEQELQERGVQANSGASLHETPE
jgi:hypothetical protein